VGSLLLTEYFTRHEGELAAEGVSLRDIADAEGTPAFVYSAGHVRAQYQALRRALEGVRCRVHYSLKANSCAALLHVLRAEGCGADVVSGGELYRAARAGFESGDIILGGVGKTRDEIRAGVEGGVKLLNVESLAELEIVDDIAGEAGRIASVGVRVNPEVAVESAHHYTKTGERGHKFGVPYDDVEHVARVAKSLKNIRLRGVGMHVGSQLRTLDAHRNGAERLLALVETLRAGGMTDLAYLDLGGGLPVRYNDERDADVEGFAGIARDVAARSGLEILLEPGRFMVANAGVLVTRILYRKRSGGTEYVIVDAGMTELLRPSHYDAFHRIEPVTARDGNGEIVADIVGPVCESGDFLARGRRIPDAEVGDLLAVHSVGAYGFVMASHYNARVRPAEVIVDGDRYAVATTRESYADLVRQENAPLVWRS